MKISKSKWTQMEKNIPPYVQVAPGIEYEVLRAKKLKNGLEGETRRDYHQMVIADHKTAKGNVITYFHEMLHSLSWEHHLHLTEQQVLEFEEAFPYLREFFKQLEGKNGK